MQKKRDKNFWKSHVLLFNKQNISQAQYCRENNLRQNYFSRVLMREKIKSKNNIDFIEIKNDVKKIVDSHIILNLGNKYSITIPAIFEKSCLDEILNILESRL